jgi:hypothetical protein
MKIPLGIPKKSSAPLEPAAQAGNDLQVVGTFACHRAKVAVVPKRRLQTKARYGANSRRSS